MPDLVIYITDNLQATFSSTPIIHRGETVEFTLQGRTDTLTVSFTPSSPFDVSQFDLDAAHPTQDCTVRNDAAAGTYTFTAIPKESRKPKRHDPLPPGSSTGDLDVSTDPPPPRDDRK